MGMEAGTHGHADHEKVGGAMYNATRTWILLCTTPSESLVCPAPPPAWIILTDRQLSAVTYTCTKERPACLLIALPDNHQKTDRA